MKPSRQLPLLIALLLSTSSQARPFDRILSLRGGSSSDEEPSMEPTPFVRPKQHHLRTLRDQFERLRTTTVPPINVLDHLTTAPTLMRLPNMYLLTLLGSAVGFHLFLYFISVGYALGIALPVAAALWQFRRSLTISSSSLLVVLWGLRSASFFLWREYVNWPALHHKIVQVHQQSSPSIGVQILCWLLYSFMYLCMLSPCWFRLEHNRAGPLHGLGLLLQLTGLGLESVADWQKSAFKTGQRYAWCHSGLWKYSTHPNYAGEWLFWTGTLLGGPTMSILETMLMLAGWIFISVVLRGAVASLDRKQSEKYGTMSEFVDFVERYGVFGPRWKQWKEWAQQSKEWSIAFVTTRLRKRELPAESEAVTDSIDTASGTAPEPPSDETAREA